MDDETLAEAELQFYSLYYSLSCTVDWVSLLAVDAPQLYLCFLSR
jgi:hypothetical protein